MKGKLFSSSSLYIVGDFINVAVSGFLLLPFYTRVLSTDEFGVYSTVNASVVLITFFAHFGFLTTYGRHFFNAKTEERKQLLAGNILLLQWFIATLLLLVMFLFKSRLEPIITAKTNISLYYYYAFMLPVIQFPFVLFSLTLRMKEFAGKFVAFQLFSTALYIAFVFILTSHMVNKLIGLFLSMFITAMVTCGVGLLLQKIRFNFKSFRINYRDIIIFSFPIFLGYVLYFLLNKFGILFLQKYDNMSNIAYFSFAVQLSSVLTIFAGSVGKAIQPSIYNVPLQELYEKIKHYSRVYKYVLLVAYIGLLLVAKPVIEYVGDGKYAKSWLPFLVLVTGVFIYNFRLIESFLFLYFEKPRYSLYSGLVSAVVVLFLTFMLVPTMGYMGSAYAILGGSVTTFLYNVLITNFKFRKRLLNDGVF